MAKVGLGVGIDFDIGGLRKGVQTATAELERLRKSSNRIGNSISAAMALPIVNFASSVMEAHAEARKIRADLMAPFSTKMMMAEKQAELMKMQVGQRMVGAGLDEPEARKIRMDAEQEVITALLAQQKGSTMGRSLETFFEAPGKYISNIVKSLEGGASYLGAVGSEALGGNLGPLAGLMTGGEGGGFEDQANRATAELALTRMQAGLALAGGQTEQFEGLRMQLERQTYILAEIERNSKGAR